MAESQKNTEDAPTTASVKSPPASPDKGDSANTSYVSRDDLTAMLAKIRQEERAATEALLKAQKEEMAVAAAAHAKEIEALKANLTTKVDLPKPADPKPPTNDELLALLEQQKAELAALKSSTPAAEEARKVVLEEIRASELKRYRSDALKASGLPEYAFPLVNGKNVEEVDKQIAGIKQTIDARDLATREEIAKQLKATLPSSGVLPGGGIQGAYRKPSRLGNKVDRAEFAKAQQARFAELSIHRN